MRTEALDFPKSILIETSNRCQGQCLFCPYSSIRKQEKTIYLDFSRYQEIINEIANYNIQRLTLFNNNEPLLDQRIYDFIQYAYEKMPNLEITLSTNGRLLTRNTLLKLKKSGLTYLYISIPTVNESEYQMIMGNNIKKIVSLLNCINDKEIIKMIRIAVPRTKFYNIDELNDKLKKYLICSWDLEYKESWNIDDSFSIISDDEKYLGPCDRPLDQMVISSNGDVIICCRDWKYDNIVGNIYFDSVYNIWHSKKMKNIQKLIIEQNYDEIACCKDCNMNINSYVRRRKKYEKK